MDFVTRLILEKLYYLARAERLGDDILLLDPSSLPLSAKALHESTGSAEGLVEAHCQSVKGLAPWPSLWLRRDNNVTHSCQA